MGAVRRRVDLRLPWLLLCAVALSGASRAAAQSTSLTGYAAFAWNEFRATTLAVTGGDLGAGTGSLVVRGSVGVPNSHLVATRVSIGGTAICAGIRANDVRGATASCPDTDTPVTPPIVTDDLASACTPPGGSFACAPGAPVLVPHDTVATLPPGVYGDVIVQGGAGGPGLLRLAGEYRFCSLRVLRQGSVVIEGPSTVSVAGSVTTSTGASILAVGVPASQVTINALGPLVRFSRGSRIGARVCALTALAKATGTDLTGQLLAGTIRLKRSSIVFDGVPPTTTTTTTTTSTSTSSTVPPVCGNGLLEFGEECDGDDFGGLTCDDASPLGAFVGSAGGGFLTCRSDCTIDASTCVVEICGNCVDDDGNGLTDFEDAACCAGEQRFAQILKKGRLKPNKKGGTKLKLKAMLAARGLGGIDPTRQDVYVQVRESSGDSLLCAKVPASSFRQKNVSKKKRVFRFRDKRAIVTTASGLQRVSVRVDREGGVRFRASGKRTALVLPEAGPLEITVAFQAIDGAEQQCSAAVRAFRTGKRAGLRFP